MVKPAPLKPPVSMSDLRKLDVRVGTIRAVEDVPASSKLVRLRVDFGDHIRSILAGLKKERDRKLIKSKGLTNQRATEQEIAIAESQHDFHRFFMITGANQFVRMLCNV